ncbi:MAG TPA: carboxypeptidase-like regulatory domain-containing protein [Candidatus Rubrimentiphilum sp.]|nr:carboxypeptidase-like regulatory domain-containing protein [Candidatus Rubrimentiphilum sp.]
MRSISSRAQAGLVLSFIFSCALCIPARADLLNTISGTVGGVVSGTLGGAVSGTLGGARGGGVLPSGPAGTVSGVSPGTMSSSPSRPEGPGSSPSLRSSVASAIGVMAHQQFVAQVLSVTPTSARVRLRDGSTRTLALTRGLAAALRAYVGKTVMLRSVDGTHLTGIVGQNDAVRGTVIAIDDNNVTMVSPNGETFVISLAANQRPRFGVGARVVAVSHDFGRTVQLSPISALADAYLGKVSGASGNTVTLRMGNQLQSFAADSAMVRLAAAHAGQTVAVDSPDGLNVKSLLSGATLLHLAAVARGTAVATNGISAAVTAVGNGRLTAQLPNGDLQTLSGNVGSLHASSSVPIVITPLDRAHFRVQSGTHAATLADANVCATANSSCKSSMQGHVVTVGPESLSVRMGNGDVSTLFGKIASLGLTRGSPITVTPLDKTLARVTSGSRVANVVRASACSTINSGCTGNVTTAPATAVNASAGDSTPRNNLAHQNRTVAGNHMSVAAGKKIDPGAAACVQINAGSCASPSGGAGTGTLPVARARVNGSVGNNAPASNLANVNRSAGRNNAIAVAGANRSAAVGCASVNSGSCASSGSPNTVPVPATKVSAGIGNGTPPNNLANTQRTAAGNNALATAGANQNAAAGCVSINAGPCVTSSGSTLQSGRVSAAVGNGTPANNLANANRSVAGNGVVATAGANRNAAAGCVAINAGACGSATPLNTTVPATKAGIAIGNGTPPNNLANTQRSAAGNDALATAGANQSSAAGCVSVNAGPCVTSSGSMTQSGKVTASVGNGPSNNLASQSRSAAGNDAAVNAGGNRNGGGGCVSINAGACQAASSVIGGNAGNGNGGNGTGGPGSGRGHGGPGISDQTGGSVVVVNGAALTAPNGNNGTATAAYTGLVAACGNDGRVIVSVADIASAKRIAGAKLHLIGSGRSDWAVTRSGAVIFAHVPAGTYRLQATRVGYKPILSPAFQVQCAVATTLKVRMARTSSKSPARSGR